MQLTKIDARVCDKLRPEIKAALADLGKKFGLEFDLGRITYADKDFKATLKVTLAGVDLEREAYQKDAKYYGLKPEWLGKSFEYRGKSYTITGLNTKSRRYPVMCNGTGFTTDLIKRSLDLEAYAAEQQKIAELNKAH